MSRSNIWPFVLANHAYRNGIDLHRKMKIQSSDSDFSKNLLGIEVNIYYTRLDQMLLIVVDTQICSMGSD